MNRLFCRRTIFASISGDASEIASSVLRRSCLFVNAEMVNEILSMLNLQIVIFCFCRGFFRNGGLFDYPSLSCAWTEGHCLRSGRSCCSALLIKAKTLCLSLTEERTASYTEAAQIDAPSPGWIRYAQTMATPLP